MKKRIIALLLSFSILCGTLTFSKRSYAAPAIVGGVIEIGIIAWELLDLMIKGEEPGIVVAIRTLIESGVDAFTNPESAFRQGWGEFWDNWGEGWESICDWLSMDIEAGIIEIIDGQIILSYEQYLEAYRLLVDVVSKPSVDFQSDYPSYFFSIEGLPSNFPMGALPTVSSLFNKLPGESYALCFYNDEQLIFSDYYIVNSYYNDRTCRYGLYYLYRNFGYSTICGGTANSNLFEYPDTSFSFPSLSYSCINIFSGVSSSLYEYTSQNCFVYSNGTVTYTPISDVDLTDFNYGLISTVADYGAFLKSLNDFSVTGSAIIGESLSDLSDVLPKEENPSLSFPLNPDLDKPIADQVIVGDVAGAEDLPLSDYMSNAVNIDLVAPPVILTKFPFCIPYDFVRFLGVLAADPIPPVFRIPISTHPKNLEQWADNETVGQYVAPDDPMFEVDEEIVLDFAHIPLVQPICYTVFIVGFVFLLLHITTKMIQH